MLRWYLQFRFAAVKCTRPSAVSALGLPVAALATHMLEAEQLATSNGIASLAACWMTWPSLPATPNRRRADTPGRPCGASTPCWTPMSHRPFFYPLPSHADSLGLGVCLQLPWA